MEGGVYVYCITYFDSNQCGVHVRYLKMFCLDIYPPCAWGAIRLGPPFSPCTLPHPAQAAGYLLRSCPPDTLRTAVRALLAEHASRPNSWERTQVSLPVGVAPRGCAARNLLYLYSPFTTCLILGDSLGKLGKMSRSR